MTITTDGLSQLVREGDTLLTETLQAKKDIAAAITPVNTSAVNSAYDAAQAVTDDADIDMALSAVIQAEIAQVDTATGNVGSIQPAANKAPVTNRHNHVEAGFIDWSQIRYAKLQNPIMRVLAPNKLVDVLDGALSWTRASTATRLNPSTGLIEVMADNEPREEKQGWLIEGSATNEIATNNSLSIQSGTSSVGTGELAPTGVNSNVYTTTSSGYNQFYTALSGDCDIGVEYTASLFIKLPDESAVPYLCFQVNGLNGGFVYYEVATETFTNSVTDYEIGFESLPNGWKRFWTRHTTTQATPYLGIKVYLAPASSDPYGGVAVGTQAYASGSQVEKGSLSSYIPTSGAAVTRAKDVVKCNFVNNGFFNVGTFYGIFNKFDPLELAYYHSMGGSASADYHLMYNLTSGLAFSIYHGQGNTFDVSKVSGAIAYTLDVNDGGKSLYVDGEHQETDATVTEITAPNLTKGLYLGQKYDGNYPYNGHMSDIRIYDFALNKHEVAFLSQGAS